MQSFALEARSLNAARMLEMESHRRYTLAAALVSRQIAQCLDDLGEMLIKKVRKMHRQAHEEFQQALLRRQTQTDQLISAFSQVLSIWVEEASVAQKHTALESILNHQVESLIELCRLHETLTRHNYLGFLWKNYRTYRAALFSLIEELRLIAPGRDKGLEQAIAFVWQHRQDRSEWLKVEYAGETYALTRKGTASSLLWRTWVDAAAFLPTVLLEGSALALVYGRHHWFRSEEQRQIANTASWAIWGLLAITSVVHFAFGSTTNSTMK